MSNLPYPEGEHRRHGEETKGGAGLCRDRIEASTNSKKWNKQSSHRNYLSRLQSIFDLFDHCRLGQAQHTIDFRHLDGGKRLPLLALPDGLPILLALGP